LSRRAISFGVGATPRTRGAERGYDFRTAEIAVDRNVECL